MRTFKGLATGLALVLLAAWSPSRAQDEDPITISLWMIRFWDAYFNTVEFEQVGDTYYGQLAQGEHATFSVQLEAGHEYLIDGACEAPCTDLDLAVIGDTELADRGPEATANIIFTVTSTRTFTVQVEMAACPQTSCRFGMEANIRRPASETEPDPLEDNLFWASFWLGYDTGSMWNRDGEPRHAGALDQGASTTFDLRLQAGREYAVVGACDAGCTDLDLAVYGATLAGADRDPDETPRVMFRPDDAGTFTVEVSMSACARNPCAFGVELYVREEELP